MLRACFRDLPHKPSPYGFEAPGASWPTKFDIYTSDVVLRTRVWSGGEIKLGTPTDTDVTIFPRPKVRDVGGNGSELEVGPITPLNAAGGYSPAMLNPDDVSGTEVFYVITGPDAEPRDYKLLEINDKKAFGYVLRLVAVDRRVPF